MWELKSNYLSTVTNQPFMLAEVRQIAEKLNQGDDWKQIEAAVRDENCLFLRSEATRNNVFLGIRSRLKNAPESVLSLLTTDTLATARLINFYLCLRLFRLLREMMAEVVCDAVNRQTSEISMYEMERFFAHKREQEQSIARWSGETYSRVQSNTLRLAIDAELLTGRGPWQWQRQLVTREVRDCLSEVGHEPLLKLMLEG